MHFELTSNYGEIIQFFIVNWNEKFFRMPVFKSSSVQPSAWQIAIIAFLLWKQIANTLFFAEKMRLIFWFHERIRICPVEVKSSGNKAHVSLDRFPDKYSSRILHKYLIYPKDLCNDTDTLCVPVCMTQFLWNAFPQIDTSEVYILWKYYGKRGCEKRFLIFTALVRYLFCRTNWSEWR